VVRRAISLSLCLGLLALGPTPLSACAMLMSMPAECAPPEAPAMCEGVQHEAEQTAIAAGDATDCCRLSAPAPEAVPLPKAAALTGLAATSLDTELSISNLPRAAFSSGADASLACSHSEQARLCVFLI
jgi:hypothetical protein